MAMMTMMVPRMRSIEGMRAVETAALGDVALGVADGAIAFKF